MTTIASKKTLVIGASDNEERYSNMAVKLLLSKQIPVVAIGNKVTKISTVQVTKALEAFTDIDTVTLYINPTIQTNYYDYILSLQPKRIIFNPGTENSNFQKLATAKGIECVEACTLVMLKTGQY